MQITSDVVVSSDSAEIGKMANESGCAFRKRDAKLCEPNTPMVDVVLDALTSRLDVYDVVVMIYPCAPLVDVADIRKGIDLVYGHGHKVAYAVHRTRDTPERALLFNGVGVVPRYPEYKDTNSDGFVDSYHSAGQWYVANAAWLKLAKTLTPLEAAGVEIPVERGFDIDTPEDWELAEYQYQRIHQKQVDADE